MNSFSKTEVAIAALVKAKECYQAQDWVASIILAGAAQQILRDLCRSRGLASTLEQVGITKGSNFKDVHVLISSAYNSMKHADLDPDASVVASLEESQVLLVLAAADLVKLSVDFSTEVKDILSFVRTFQAH
jgi:hypothetical protein